MARSKRETLSAVFVNAGRWPAILGFTVLAGGAVWGVETLQEWRALKLADQQLQKGFGALAAETLTPYRKSLTKSEKGCQEMISAFFQARKTEVLEWASQACLEGGHEIPEAYIGIAAVREFTGRDQDALQVLNGVVGKFDKSPDIYYRMAQILRRLKRDNEAVVAYQKAVERAPQANQLVMDSLEYFSSLNRWSEARAMAEKIKDVQTDSPEVKLVIARALQRGGDKGAAESVVAAAKALLDKKPELKQAIEQNYNDVLNGGQVAAVPNGMAGGGTQAIPSMPPSMGDRTPAGVGAAPGRPPATGH
jgi:tetratricopeptide (TPR) repeat protein